jgi:cytidylate kinase
MSFIVAIDGPAGSGKGTITKLVGKKQNLINIDTGAMYRCVSLNMIKENIELNETNKIKEILEKINIEFKNINDEDRFFLNGEDVTKEIRNQEVNDIVSQVSHIPIVRESMVDLQRKMSVGKEIIMEGRDIATNVFPNADVKIYLDASAEERAKRRLKQNAEKGIDIPYEEILKNIIFRDNNDKTSNVAPLKQAEDAIYLDSTNLTIEEVVDKIEQIAPLHSADHKGQCHNRQSPHNIK